MDALRKVLSFFNKDFCLWNEVGWAGKLRFLGWVA